MSKESKPGNSDRALRFSVFPKATACGAREPFVTVQARASFGPTVKNVTRCDRPVAGAWDRLTPQIGTPHWKGLASWPARDLARVPRQLATATRRRATRNVIAKQHTAFIANTAATTKSLDTVSE